MAYLFKKKEMTMYNNIAQNMYFVILYPMLTTIHKAKQIVFARTKTILHTTCLSIVQQTTSVLFSIIAAKTFTETLCQ
jgi:cation transporter-like permease